MSRRLTAARKEIKLPAQVGGRLADRAVGHREARLLQALEGQTDPLNRLVALGSPGSEVRDEAVSALQVVNTAVGDVLRDLGGYPTLDGATTRWGQVFRSDRLDGLSDADEVLTHGTSPTDDDTDDDGVPDYRDPFPEDGDRSEDLGGDADFERWRIAGAASGKSCLLNW